MKERPILFSVQMVRAILKGRKTQTRRVVKWPSWIQEEWERKKCAAIINSNDYRAVVKRGSCDGIVGKFGCPYGVPGDRLWVKETWTPHENPSGHDGILYDADGSFVGIEKNKKSANAWLKIWDPRRQNKWRPSIYMPRWASRITLEVVDVRVERVCDISDDDAWKEGINQTEAIELPCSTKIASIAVFSNLWDSINKKRGYGWDTNPWVWVVEFREEKP
jgi:hypothetical protein